MEQKLHHFSVRFSERKWFIGYALYTNMFFNKGTTTNYAMDRNVLMEAQQGLNKNLSQKTITTIHIYYSLYKNKQGKMNCKNKTHGMLSKSSYTK